MKTTTTIILLLGLTSFISCDSSNESQSNNEEQEATITIKKEEVKKSSTTTTSTSEKTQNDKAETAVEMARSLVGTPYKSAGTSKNGIDASALTMLSWEAAGVKLARISQEQARQGKKVATEDAQPGDLVFFSTQKGSSRVSNCGIITKKTAQGFNFIYTSSKDGVKETAFSPYWKDRLVVIKRVG
ncbi:C40 family peptidase [Flammeovirga yaeyamensis]|uniref:C40 family peptidase n=1 Tax=Flammeovirga yaeyamensis TaxID=367791 RepID=A0AAX1NB87_9BACT|nr:MULTISPECIES: NlpC/P60 family protein [Flammeovirga]ANQ49640.1 C40 family peptidase [Flammeovirga sp. MY04]MBB3697492.1 cell wall-associated NlpC family hydrolase [Flammeovirga yaeyamensis]NMF36186.1 C40 family peptidase [Flammeovirga yaeyamensis]QWG02918.1 C40 family peptidase [Flammeovirga yaeyamensis]